MYVIITFYYYNNNILPPLYLYLSMRGVGKLESWKVEESGEGLLRSVAFIAKIGFTIECWKTSPLQFFYLFIVVDNICGGVFALLFSTAKAN